MSDPTRHRVVIVGGGFGGLHAALHLRRAPVDLTLIDRRNFHLFQPLLYQVATGALSPGEIASPLRGVLKRTQRHACCSPTSPTSTWTAPRPLRVGGRAAASDVSYDSLIVATGAGHPYFGHDEGALAPGLKTLEDAMEIRRRVLTAFEAAESSPTPTRARCLTFVVVGGGPTGVELAGRSPRSPATRCSATSAASTPHRPDRPVEGETGAAHVPGPSRSAKEVLEKLGVTVWPTAGDRPAPRGRHALVPLDRTEPLAHGAVGCRRPGVAAGGILAQAGGADLTARAACVNPVSRSRPPRGPVIGDMVLSDPGRAHPLPGVAPAAMQMGGFAAKSRRGCRARRRRGRSATQGQLATIGRGLRGDGRGPAVGPIAWLGWLFVHLLYLTGLENRVIVFIRWTVSFITHGRGARLITGEAPEE